jgi:hypothetical protein
MYQEEQSNIKIFFMAMASAVIFSAVVVGLLSLFAFTELGDNAPKFSNQNLKGFETLMKNAR